MAYSACIIDLLTDLAFLVSSCIYHPLTNVVIYRKHNIWDVLPFFFRLTEIPWQGRDLVDVARRTFQSRVVLGLFPLKMLSSLGEVQYSVMRVCLIHDNISMWLGPCCVYDCSN